MRFLQAAEALFFKGPSVFPVSASATSSSSVSFFLAGWQLGSDPEIQVATVVSNHLTAGLLKYFGDSFRFDRTVNLFERLLPHQPEVAALLATSYLGMSQSR
jgi:hypothetical protein